MPKPPASFAEFLQRKILPNVQRIALLITVVGLAFRALHYAGASELLMIGLSTLAITVFFMALIPVHIPAGCNPDWYATIIFKIIYIGSAVGVTGILFHFLKLQEAENILLIGCVSIGAALIAAAILVVKTKDNWIVLKEAMFRGGGIFLLSVYMMYQASIL